MLKEVIDDHEDHDDYEVRTRRANVRLSEGDYMFLKELAKERSVSVSEIVRNWVADRVMVYRNQKDVASMASFMNAVFNTIGHEAVQGAFVKDLMAGEDFNLADALKNQSEKK